MVTVIITTDDDVQLQDPSAGPAVPSSTNSPPLNSPDPKRPCLQQSPQQQPSAPTQESGMVMSGQGESVEHGPDGQADEMEISPVKVESPESNFSAVIQKGIEHAHSEGHAMPVWD
jgi:hypothetical protein